MISWKLIVLHILDLIHSTLLFVGLKPGYLIWRIRSTFNRHPESARDGSEGEQRAQGFDLDSMLSEGKKMMPLRNRARRRVGGARVERESERMGALYPGMVNLSGTLCYMNSVLQSFASLTYFHHHLELIMDAADGVDIATNVVDELIRVLEDLNRPSPSYQPAALRPSRLIDALTLLPRVRRLLSTREHQDAHELFLLLTSAVADEEGKVAKEVRGRERGLGWVTDMEVDFTSERAESTGPAKMVADGESTDHAENHDGLDNNSKRSPTPTDRCNSPSPGSGSRRTPAIMPPRNTSPLEGLSANRRSCLECGWCESIRYETMGPLDVAVPMSGHVSLLNCIRHFTKIETLSATCDACTIRLTLNYYASEATRLAAPPPDADPSAPASIPPSRKKRAREARRILGRLKAMREANDLTDLESRAGLEDVKWVKMMSRNTKQAMIARPPPILCLHLVRSEYTNYGQVVKKTPHIAFPSVLDITDFCTTGSLRMTSDGPISGGIDGWDESPRKSHGNTNRGIHEADPRPPRVLYRLDAIICHYGFTHSFGHFVAYRRIPNTSGGPDLPRKACPDYCECEESDALGQVRWSDTPGRGWLRISDADVEEVGESEVLGERGSAFLLFYERVQEWRDEEAKTSQSGEPKGSVMDALRAQRETVGAGGKLMENGFDDLM